MGGDQDRFSVDPDELDEIIRDLQRTENRLERIGLDLDRQMKTLHDTWEGLAATAQKEAHAEWAKGMAAMHAALKELRAAARVAHGNYQGAAKTNLTMWQQVR